MNDDSQFHNNREQNGGKNSLHRKNSSNKFNDNKGNRYSPSASYNYNGQSSRNNTSFQQPRRRIERFKRDSGGDSTDRLMKQNDTMIKLLKEIRDSLSLLTQNGAPLSVNQEEQRCDSLEQLNEQKTPPFEKTPHSEEKKEPVPTNDAVVISDKADSSEKLSKKRIKPKSSKKTTITDEADNEQISTIKTKSKK